MAEPPANRPPPERVPVVVLERRPKPVDTLALLDLLSYLMDRCFELPGTRLRFGLNSLMLLVPVLGDILAGLVSLLILTIGLNDQRVPRIVAARMLVNSLLDTTLSAIPLLGNVWDIWFKADTRNVNLLRQYVGESPEPPPTWRHWVFVVVVLMLFIALLALLVLGAVVLLTTLVRGFQTPAG